MTGFDFCVFDDAGRVAFLIEYQGKQHYEASGKFGGKKGFYQQAYNDEHKRRWCRLNGITLLEIPYTDYNILSYDYIMERSGYL